MLIRAATLSLLLSLAACGPSTDSPPTPATPPPTDASNSATPDSTKAEVPKADVLIPDSAEYTIYCTEITTSNHSDLAGRIKDKLVQESGMDPKGWYLVETSTYSKIYYGFYGMLDDGPHKAEQDRFRADHEAIQALVDTAKKPLFPQAGKEAITRTAQSAHPEWDLATIAPAKGYWTLQVGVYTHSTRESDAIETVEQARAQGIPAYYYNGPSASSVCIGVWPKEAVQRSVDDAARPMGNPNDFVIVLPPGYKTPQNAAQKTEDGRDVVYVEQGYSIVNDDLKKTMTDNPDQATDGNGIVTTVVGADGSKQKITDPSLLVVLPQAQAAEEAAAPTHKGEGPSFPAPGGDGAPAGGSPDQMQGLPDRSHY